MTGLPKSNVDNRLVRVSGIYAHEGEWVICEGGHNIAQFGRTVKCGENFDDAALVDWQQERPKRGNLECPCERCGARFYAGTQFHFKDGWRVFRDYVHPFLQKVNVRQPVNYSNG